MNILKKLKGIYYKRGKNFRFRKRYVYNGAFITPVVIVDFVKAITEDTFDQHIDKSNRNSR